MTDYLHGVETIREEQPASIQDATTSINAVVVSVPTFLLKEEYQTLNRPVPIRGYSDITKYAGKNVEGFTGYDALYTIMTESEGASIYMINVFDKDKHKSSKTVETAYLKAGKYTINEPGVTNLTVGDGVLDTDYTFENGVITVTPEGKFKDSESVSITYDYADVTKLTAADFIGKVDEDNIKTGLQAVYDIQALYGDEVSILTIPVYSALKAVRSAMESVESKLKLQSYYDSPVGTSINKAIQGRQGGVDGSIDLTSSSENGMFCLPYVYRYNAETDSDELRPPSPAAAGMRVRLDRERNVAKSIDNTKSLTTNGTEFPIGFNLSDPTSESNALNAKGISTFINYKGSYYFWGSRNANFPTADNIETFESIQRTASYIERSIQNSSFQCVGETITQGFIDDVLNMIESFLNKLKNPQNQIIIDGEVWYDKEQNPVDELSKGRIRFSYKFCPPPPVERLTYSSFIDIQLMSNLGGGN